MGNCKSKKVPQKEPDKFFEREKFNEQLREENRKRRVKHIHRRPGKQEVVLPPVALAPPPDPGPVCAPAPQHVRPYDEEALERMRFQLRNDSDAFLLNNILLSVQFFENYEREVHQIKNNPISEREHLINEAMVRHNKHVFFADRLQECVHEHVIYKRSRGQTEPVSAPRHFVIYDNVEASEPGDTSDYSAVLDAPFYKLRIEDGKVSGYVKLKKLEVLESTLHRENNMIAKDKPDSDDSVYTDSEKESNDSDDYPYHVKKGEELLRQIKTKLGSTESFSATDAKDNSDTMGPVGRRYSGPIKQVSLQVTKSNISNMNKLRKNDALLLEEQDEHETNNNVIVEKKGLNEDSHMGPRKSILKYSRRLSGPIKDLHKYPNTDMRPAYSEGNLADDTETSGYRSNSSSRHTESSETESDYGYSTITEAATPKKIELSVQSDYSLTSGALPDESWTAVDVKAFGEWSDDEDDEVADTGSKSSLSRNLFEKCYYLNSLRFMNNFVDNFIINLGSALGLTVEEINSALTQGASIYCDSIKNGSKIGYEIFPALVAAWPNAANPWIIRERKVIRNPRNNKTYQWPTKYMVSKATGFGCLLVPIGFREKRGQHPEQPLQWKIIFPAAERYLESCLAHSHIRCYLFAMAIHKTFIENETAKIGIDASHIKNHLFWECEDNYAKWPEDRLGESLRLFLRNFYIKCAKRRMPNYFVESCNELSSIPKPLLGKQQKKIAEFLEAPVTHVLNALKKMKYTKRDFYPKFNSHRLYDILTCKNPLRMINPNLPPTIPKYPNSSDSEEEAQINYWDKAKDRDKNYQFAKEAHRQMQERRKVQVHTKRHRSEKPDREIVRNVILPKKMEAERRRLVFEFFIPHFIAMARSSEKFEAIRQALIYLEQAQRLCLLLLEEPGGDTTANEYLEVIREKLHDCQRKLVKQGGFKLPPRRNSKLDRVPHQPIRRHRPKFEDVQDSPTDSPGISAFTFVDVHSENSFSHDHMKLNEFVGGDESKL